MFSQILRILILFPPLQKSTTTTAIVPPLDPLPPSAPPSINHPKKCRCRLSMQPCHKTRERWIDIEAERESELIFLPRSSSLPGRQTKSLMESVLMSSESRPSTENRKTARLLSINPLPLSLASVLVAYHSSYKIANNRYSAEADVKRRGTLITANYPRFQITHFENRKTEERRDKSEYT